MVQIRTRWRKAAFSTLTLTLLILAGCAGASEPPVVAQKGDAQLEEQILATSDGSGQATQAWPERVRQTFPSEDGAVVIAIDAVVEAPPEPVPSAAVSPRRFTPEDAANVIVFLTKGGALYADSADRPSAERISGGIENANELLAAVSDQPDLFQGANRYTAQLARTLETLGERAKTAQPIAAFDPVLPAFRTESADGKTEAVSGGLLIDGRYFSLRIENGALGGALYCTRLQEDPVALKLMQPYDLIYFNAGEEITGVSYAASLVLAQEIVSGIGAGDMTLGAATGVEYPADALPGYYQFSFVRQVNGAAIGMDEAVLAEDVYNAGVPDESFTSVWPYESLQVRVDAKGLLRVQWISPMTVMGILTERTALLPLDEIVACFGKLASVKGEYREQLGWQNDSGGTASGIQTNVELIRLSLMRVESGGGFLLVPVWDFYGTQELLDQNGNPMSFAVTIPNSEYTEYGVKGEAEFTSSLQKPDEEIAYNRRIERRTSLLTINAVDGTIVDRLMGY